MTVLKKHATLHVSQAADRIPRKKMRTNIDRIGKYELRAVLARTPMSTVYDGWDADIARRVAVKLMPLSCSDDTEAADAFARFKRGAQAAGQLNHPNIVGIYDYGETQDYAYLVMEFIGGPTLKGLLDDNQRFALPEICKIIGSVLDALQYSHDRGVVHRDVKPANIMFRAEGEVKITDFGIARLEDSEMTQAGMVIGTPAYMSPEQFLGEKIDFRTDIYSTGVVLYHILTGERPYEGNLATIMHKVLYGSPPLASRLSTLATPAIDALVTRAMARNREDRFRSASEFNAALQAARTVAPFRPAASAFASGSIGGRLRPSGGPGFKPSARVLVPVLALASVLGLVAGYVFDGRSPPAPLVAQDRPRDQPQDQRRQVTPQPNERNAVLGQQQHDDAVQKQQEQGRLEQQVQARLQEEQAQRQQQEDQARLQQQQEQIQQQQQREQARLQQQQEQMRLQQQEQARQQQEQARLQQQREQARQQQQQQQQEQSRLKRLQEKTRPPPPPDQGRQKLALDQGHQNLEQGQAGQKPEPESGSALVPPAAIYPVTSTSGLAGLVCVSLTAETAARYGLDGPRGMAVTGVVAGGAAEKAGIRDRDVILRINGIEVRDLSMLTKIAADRPAGQSVPVDIMRNGSRRVMQLLLGQ